MKKFFKKIHIKIITLVLLVAVAIPVSFAVMPTEKAEASTSGCLGSFFSALGISEATNAVSAVSAVPTWDYAVKADTSINTAQSTGSFLRDCIEHGLALSLGKYILSAMTNEIVTWINSGFEGKPAFVTNPGQFLVNTADQIAGEFIAGSALNFLCSPFKLSIQIQLALDYSTGVGNQGQQCTLSKAFNNIQNAFTNFSDGGISGWFSMTQNVSNNPYGSYLQARTQMDAQISGAQNIELLKLNWNGGFLSWSECTSTDGSSYNQYGGKGSFSVAGKQGTFGGPRSTSDNCTTKTPGNVIASQLENQLNVPANQLGLADDLDKIFNALANQLFQKVLAGAGGLLGSTQGATSNGGAGSRLDQWVTETDAARKKSEKEKTSSESQLNNIETGAQPTGGSSSQNIAQRKIIDGSSFSGPTDKLTDGDRSNAFDDEYTGTMTTKEQDPWLQINLDKEQPIDRVVIFQRPNPSNASHGIDFTVQILDKNKKLVWESANQVQNFQAPIDLSVPAGISGQYVKLQGKGFARLEFSEVEVYQNVAPTITLKGTTPMSVSIGSQFVDPGATATDEKDGDLTSKIVVTGVQAVDTTKAGTYKITYNVKDSGDLAAKEITRQVVVQNPQDVLPY